MAEIKKNPYVVDWVNKIKVLCKADAIHWCDGSEKERLRLTAAALASGELEELDQYNWPGCYYHRSMRNDVARAEHLTFICSREKDAAGRNNNWMHPETAYQQAKAISKDAMKGRILYVIPFVLGHPNSPFKRVGVQITDSIYIVLNMRIMTRMGDVAAQVLADQDSFTRCVHVLAGCDEAKRLILHFPEDNTIWAVGSGYGGNALLSKKCLALRMASVFARKEGWLAEHMLILGIQNPQGETHYICAAFPSACGKTNLAMLLPPLSYQKQGWKVYCLGDDIAWLRIGTDGRLWAINPEFGFFGVVPGTNAKSNRNALETIRSNTIFTNVLKYKDTHGRYGVWWEDGPQVDLRNVIAHDWQGREWTPDSGIPGAHENSRFTAPILQCPVLSPAFNDIQGVPIDAIIFGGRRPRLTPLVYQSFDWQHGTFVGASMASELTAAQMGPLGKIRRDPMAMLPFCAYNMRDYWQHWLDMGEHLGDKAPKIFHVNWFRSSEKNILVWPGFGDNLRVLEWILKRCHDAVPAEKTKIGYLPRLHDINMEGIQFDPNVVKEFVHEEAIMRHLFHIDPQEWQKEIENQHLFLFGNNDKQLAGDIPTIIQEQHEALKARFS